MEIVSKIQNNISESLKILDIDVNPQDIIVEMPDDNSNGDYSANIAMRLASQEKMNPRELAQNIVDNIEEDLDFKSIEVAGPGFINFYLSEKYLLKVVSNIVDQGEEYFKLDSKKDSNIVIEYTDPNPFKIFHIGHVYTNCVGESFARLQEALGASVKRACYQGDVGLHVAKTLWGLEKKFEDEGMSFSNLEKMDLVSRVRYLGDAYILGTDYYDNIQDSDVVEEINDINYYLFTLSVQSLEKKDFSKYEEMFLADRYMKGRQWCLDYFETIYERLGTHYDYYFFETEVGEAGLKIVLDNVGKIFEEDDGAIIYKGDEKKGLHTRVFVNKYGIPTYETKELGLAMAKSKKIDFDESVVITGDEQIGYFKVVFDALGRLDKGVANVTSHVSHGLVKLPGAKKMSSREGSIVAGEDVLNATKDCVKEVMVKSDRVDEDKIEELSEKITIAAIKYAFLKVGVGKDVIYDVDESISFDGNTGPYLLYVYARCNSILKEAEMEINSNLCFGQCLENAYLKELMLQIDKYKKCLLDSGESYSPSTLCLYLFELGKKFNSFYQNVRVLDAPEETQGILLSVVYATMIVMQDGLKNLGIEVVDEM